MHISGRRVLPAVNKLPAVAYFGAGACHPTICLGIYKKHSKITEEEMTTSPVLDTQCTNCYCFGQWSTL